MRVINYDSSQINVIDTTDTRLPHGASDIFTKDEMLKYFGIDYTGYLAVTYEPNRGLYIVDMEDTGKTESFADPTKEPLLKKLHDKEDDIIDYLILRHMKRELPSKFHRIENYEFVLPKEHEAAYQAELEKKEAWQYLNSTTLYALRAMEQLQDPNNKKVTLSVVEEDPILVARRVAYDKMGDDYFQRKIGMKMSEGSEARAQAGIDPLAKMSCSPDELKDKLLLKK